MLKRIGRGEERILWPIVFLSLNTKEQLLGRVMLSGNSIGGLILLVILVLLFWGIYCSESSFPPLLSSRLSPSP